VTAATLIAGPTAPTIQPTSAWPPRKSALSGWPRSAPSVPGVAQFLYELPLDDLTIEPIHTPPSWEIVRPLHA